MPVLTRISAMINPTDVLQKVEKHKQDDNLAVCADVTPSLRISTPSKEGILQVSKWLQWQVLLDEKEMSELFASLPKFNIHIVSTIVNEPHGRVQYEEFLEEYGIYIKALKQGEEPDEKRCRPYFSAIFTKEVETLYAMRAGAKYLIKPILPVIQLQLHHVFRGNVDGKYYPMVHAADSITWGVQFAYPQLFQDPQNRNYLKVDESARFPNTALFTQLVKWLRQYTLPTPFIFEGDKVNVPIRLGKECWSWIARHPHLLRKRITVSPRQVL